MATLSTVISYGEPTGTVITTIGTPGPSGQAATVQAGTTTTSAPGTNASVTNSGSTSAAIFDFTIPRGAVGATGAAGAKGDTGAAGAAASVSVGSTTTTSPGTSATVYNSGSTSAAVLNFGIPRGADGQTGPKGDTGNTGAKGDAATISVGTVTTGTAGSSASITNVGTSSAAVFNFSIPRGNTGNAGTPGVGVPVGGSAGQVLAKVDGVDYNTAWVNQSGSTFTGGDIAGPITMHGGTIDTEMSSDFFGVELTSDPTQYAELQYNALTVAGGGSSMQVTNTGVTFPDSSVQSTAAVSGFVPGSGDLDMMGYSVTNANFSSSAGQVSAQNITMSSGGVLTFGDSTVQTTAANPFNGGTISGDITIGDSGDYTAQYAKNYLNLAGPGANAFINAADGIDLSNSNNGTEAFYTSGGLNGNGGGVGSFAVQPNNIYCQNSADGGSEFNAQGGYLAVFDQTTNQTLSIHAATGITFPDSTTQTSAAFVPGSGDLNMAQYGISGYGNPIVAGNFFLQSGYGGAITFSDNTVQTTAATSGIPDAPNDGNIYARQNGSWVQIG